MESYQDVMESYRCWDFYRDPESRAEAVSAICELDAAKGFASRLYENNIDCSGRYCIGVKDRAGDVSIWAVEVQLTPLLSAYKLSVK
jgi:hypothetical protein